jgi:hypothetical protein
MRARPRAEAMYGPLTAKTFPAALSYFLTQEFPHLGGPKVRELFVAEVVRLVEQFYPAPQRLQPGQTVWLAVAKSDRPKDHQPLTQTHLLPVILTLVDQADIHRLMKGTSRVLVTQEIIARIHREADEQGAVLAQTDTALLLAFKESVISQRIRDYEKRTGQIIPRRGTIHDLGPTVSHKATIARKALLERKSTSQTASTTNHTPKSVDRYLLDLTRCYICLKRAGQSVEQTAFTTGLSLNLVREYAALIDELGLSDDQLPDLLAKLDPTVKEQSDD